MKVLIIEDEVRAGQRLAQMLRDVDPEIHVMATAESVKDAVKFLSAGQSPQLIFSDIQLEDGLSFEIFEQVEVRCPIIFITAYDQYAIDAFKTNGIDYLLKPVDPVRLLQSLNKVKKLSPGLSIDNILALANASMSRNKYKNRFVIRIGERIKTVGVEEVVAFFSQDNATYMLHKDGRRYPLDYSLDLIESMVNPDAFFRVSRKFIVSINACSDITAWSNSRLKINLPGVDDQMVVVARERVQQFKQWLDSN
jgi:DNA-binding LytR/AlgR family response regulator